MIGLHHFSGLAIHLLSIIVPGSLIPLSPTCIFLCVSVLSNLTIFDCNSFVYGFPEFNDPFVFFDRLVFRSTLVQPSSVLGSLSTKRNTKNVNHQVTSNKQTSDRPSFEEYWRFHSHTLSSISI